jgi:DNA-binding NarL/FixJ family response regulator
MKQESWRVGSTDRIRSDRFAAGPLAAVVRIEGLDRAAFAALSGAWQSDARETEVELPGSDAIYRWFGLSSEALAFVATATGITRERGHQARAAVHLARNAQDDSDPVDSIYSTLETAMAAAHGERLIISVEAASMLLGSHVRLGAVVANVEGAGRDTVRFLSVVQAGEEQSDFLAVDRPRRNRSPRPAAPLSARERQVASLVAEGRSNRDVARLLSIAISTVERHVASLFAKLNVDSRVEIATLGAAGQL